MLAGRRAFAGDTAADTISAVLSTDPEWTSGRKVITPALHRSNLDHIRDAINNIEQYTSVGRDALWPSKLEVFSQQRNRLPAMMHRAALTCAD
jgi:cytochrome P450